MIELTAYLSHSIRGENGVNATQEEIEKNCKDAHELVDFIRKHVPELDAYVPAEHEEFVYLCYTQKFLTEKQILDIDCSILEKKDLLLVLVKNGWVGGGIATEIAHAKRKGIPIIYLYDTDSPAIKLMKLLEYVNATYMALLTSDKL